MKKKILIFLSLIVFWFAFGPIKSAQAQKVYQIGTDVTYPPFEFANKNNKYVGIDIDIMKAIAKEEGFKVQIKPVGFNAAVQSMEAGQLDGVIAGMMMTPERKAKFDFSQPYFDTGIIMAVGKNSKIKNFEQLRGKKVALKTGTAAALYANSIKKKYGFKTVTFDDSNNMYQDVVTKNSVACFEDKPVMQYAINQGTPLKIPVKPANKSTYGFAVRKGHNQELLAKFDAGLKKIKANGTYDKIKNKYLGTKHHKVKPATEDRSFWGLIKQNQDALLGGLGETVWLTVAAIFFATIFGIIVGLLGVVPNKFCNGLSTTIIYIFRGLPLLVLALFIYTGIPSLSGQKIPAFLAGIITLTLNEGAYIAAFVKGGIDAVDSG
ncbi:ABC transporter permease subunit, partial [Bombilactobacillus mellis]